MASPTYSEFFRRRAIGRAPSPPMWACYEQIPFEDDYSDSASEDNSCSEDDDDYCVRAPAPVPAPVDSGDAVPISSSDAGAASRADGDGDMEIDERDEALSAAKITAYKTDVKGKQRAVEPAPASPSPNPKRQHRRKPREPTYTLRPILTIQRSQGFVWNQDLFVPPYIKDRYVASTAAPNMGFISSSVSSTNSSLMDYEVEVVEIRVTEGELQNIIP